MLLRPALAGPNGIAAILARCPEIMLCKPTTNDRWDRRAVELSAYLLRNGHCNVPEVGARAGRGMPAAKPTEAACGAALACTRHTCCCRTAQGCPASVICIP